MTIAAASEKRERRHVTTDVDGDTVTGAMGSRSTSASVPWNHNIHYYPVVLREVPAGAQHALDVGCGDGSLARQLRQTVRHVTAIDADGPILGLARQRGGAEEIDYRHGDFLTFPFEPGSFDFISSVAALHHMDEANALERMAELLRPGGRLAVVGLAHSRHPGDLPWDLTGALVTRLHKLTKFFVDTEAPKVWPPPHTYRQFRRLSSQALPGRTYRRLVLWRYVLTWTKPNDPA
jgi:SAM-dependent methyltransferase